MKHEFSVMKQVSIVASISVVGPCFVTMLLQHAERIYRQNTAAEGAETAKGRSTTMRVVEPGGTAVGQDEDVGRHGHREKNTDRKNDDSGTRTEG